ncbi:MAG: tetratricopeptide repeat protein [Bdellovibrionaceae bacterium]|nr:tetratricopeptide repeat protein [Pseudobdellovibrionaceae bacterium]
MHVIKADLHALNSNWLLSQVELERALELQADDSLKLRRALVIAQRGQYALAEEELKKLTYASKSNDVEAYLALGEIQALQNKAAESIATYKQALSIDPNNYKALIFLGAIYSQLDNIQTSNYYFGRLKRLPEYRHLGFYYTGRLQQQIKNYAKSILEFKKCSEIREDFLDCLYSLADSYILNADKAQAIKLLEAHKEQNPDNERTYSKLYDLYTEAQDTEKAFEQLAALERFEPQNTYIKLQMAMYFLMRQELAEAEVKLQEILDISPKFDRAHFLLTSIFTREKDLEKVTRYYSMMNIESPYFIEASLMVGRLTEELQGPVKALQLIQTKNKKLQDSRLNIYAALLNGKLDKPQESIKILEKVVKNDPQNTQALYYLGHLQGENGQFDKAIVQMRRALLIDPNHVDALNYIAYYFAENKINLDEALRMATKANELRPNDGHILDTMGWIYFHKGEFNQAVSYLEKAYVLNPEESTIAEHLAQVYSSKGFSDKALQVYNKLLQQGVVNREKILRQINSIGVPPGAASDTK